MRIGVTELLVVLLVALLVLGPDKLPHYAQKLGAALAEFRKASDEAAQDIRENIVEPLEDVAKPVRETDRAIRDNLNEVQTSLEQVGRETKS